MGFRKFSHVLVIPKVHINMTKGQIQYLENPVLLVDVFFFTALTEKVL